MDGTCVECTAKGDLAKCEATPCSKHDSWYAVQLKQLIEDLKNKQAQPK